MNRRDVLRLLAVAVPALSGLSAPQRAALEGLVPGHPRLRGLFDPQQFATVDILSEIDTPATETPGAHAAGVAAFIELIVADWYGDADRDAFVAGLADVDARSMKLSGRPFIEAEPARRLAMVEGLDASLAAGDADPFWSRFKALTLYGFFSSEPGVREVLRTPFMPGYFNGDAPVAQAGGQG